MAAHEKPGDVLIRLVLQGEPNRVFRAFPARFQPSNLESGAVLFPQPDRSVYGRYPFALSSVLLDKKDREIAGSGNLLAQRIQEANDWAKKYHELEQRLATAEDDSEVSEKARSLIKAGEFERAGALLDQLIGKQEQRQDVLAANHFNRAELHSLKFEPHLAIPHYESAYRYRPQNFGYAFAYALALHKQFRLADAEVVYNSLVNRQPEVSTEAGKDGKARVLNNLAILYSDTQRPGEAEKAYDEALGIYRELAKRNPEVYRPVVAVTLNNLANLYRATQRPGEAEKAINEARNFQTR